MRTERVAHRALVRQEVRGPRPDSGEAELLGDGGHDGDGAIGGHGEHPVDPDSPRDLEHFRDGREVDHLGDVGLREARRLRVAIDRDDTQPARSCLCDRAALMASCAHEENRRHGGRW